MNDLFTLCLCFRPLLSWGFLRDLSPFWIHATIPYTVQSAAASPEMSPACFKRKHKLICNVSCYSWVGCQVCANLKQQGFLPVSHEGYSHRLQEIDWRVCICVSECVCVCVCPCMCICMQERVCAAQYTMCMCIDA